MTGSWVEIPANTDFTLDNLPYGVFSTSSRPARCGVALGNLVLDLSVISCLLKDIGGLDPTCFAKPALNEFMACSASVWKATRARLLDLLREGGSRELRDDQALVSRAFVKLDSVKMHLPAVIPDYTDFYSSRDHAFNCGCMFRDPANALQPNWLHLPVGYHGRASTVYVSGTEIVRPRGQLQKDKADPKKGSEYGPCKNLDFEMEIAFFVGGAPLKLGETITMDNVEDRIFGLVLMNDWSARDIQSWEYVPLGPFGSKNFATSISPWIVPYEALKPFTCETISKVQQDPEPLEYLKDPHYSSFDIDLTVSIQGQAMPQAEQVCHTNMRNLYWNIKQQLVHHTVTGCRMRPGDLLGTGTISGGEQDALGSLLEMSWRGTRDVPLGSSGENRKFLKDFDQVIMRGKCQKKVTDENGNERVVSLGFGECNGA
eukprot:753519-Hanusia_phi.AAC.1